MKTLYFDCFSGISGDMTVGALLSLGADFELLRATLSNLSVSGYKISHYNCMKNGIAAHKFEVECAHEHEHRTLSNIFDILNNAKLAPKTDAIARDIFTRIAKAEAKIHGVSISDVHFHEVGAIDSIVDVVATAECISQIGPDRIVFSKIREGHGEIYCEHGVIPVPAPATLEILMDAGAILVSSDTVGEMVTPTGAGIVAALGDEFGTSLPEGKVLGIGYGAGTKDFAHPNILRAVLVEQDESDEDFVLMLEAQVDDMTGEQLGFAMERIFDAGALDVYYTPIYMKKNRPATHITAICKKECESNVGNAILKHTSTLGYRINTCRRKVMSRDMIQVETKYGIIPVKCAKYNEIVKYHPEYDAVHDAAIERNVSYADVLCEVNLQLSKL